MVSNDEMNYILEDLSLQPIVRKTITATSGTNIFTVPVSKRWIIRNVSNYRFETGDIEIQLTDGRFIVKLVGLVGGNELIFYPGARLVIPPGWEIRIVFGTGTSGQMITHMLYEEDIERN